MANTSIDTILKIEPFVNISGEGIQLGAFVGDDDMPTGENVITWSDILDEEIEFHCIPNGPIVVDALNDGVGELQKLVEDLHNVADLLEDKMRKKKVFVRSLVDEGKSPEDATISYSRYLRGEY